MDIVTNDFRLTSSFMTDEQVLSGQYVPGEETAKEEAEDFFNTIDTIPPDIDLEKTKIEYFTISNGTLSNAASRANAQLARVDLYQKAIEKIPVVYPKPPYSTMYVLLGTGRNDPIVVEAAYLHQAIDTGKKDATYPIKTSQEAFEELQRGKAHIISYFGSSSSISLKNVYVGYYLSDKQQQYAYPVVVFEGDSGFVAYVSLIENQWFST
jgi:hypothetical protein